MILANLDYEKTIINDRNYDSVLIRGKGDTATAIVVAEASAKGKEIAIVLADIKAYTLSLPDNKNISLSSALLMAFSK
jgi:shikimate 5-dehydrogenase